LLDWPVHGRAADAAPRGGGGRGRGRRDWGLKFAAHGPQADDEPNNLRSRTCGAHEGVRVGVWRV